MEREAVMPTDRERREQFAAWNREGRPSPFDNVGCGGCLWILAALFAFGMLIIVCSSGGLAGR
ncbi:hypothetical protein Aab01nite_06760 [Paractinoplanes abujensis]|uniref:Uncharacterized protein n=1 Tax=Paractinoplanes abujensis TaxID=882441 RepID=A0A7W7CMY5_9ACTN|nr:hypothetical protein [Actinoplanes abujensis]MBB4691498.1 hypothetical protein [Actinoplanes abujensis]GID17086.1 hypothetical protein Aab01nite_06760 [Actinoplanes abujensis]